MVEPKDNISGSYLFYMLRSNFVYNQILGKITGTTGRRRLDIFVFNNILIPLPPLSIQQRIAEEVHKRMEKAKKLKEETKEILAKAKEKAERMILGGDED